MDFEFLNFTLILQTKEDNGQYYFQCQHGETECYANKIHACSIETFHNTTISVKFTECMISDNNDPDEALSRVSINLMFQVFAIFTHKEGISLYIYIYI